MVRTFRGASLCVGMLLALSANAASAAALGSLATSVGLFAALGALFVIKGWPAHLPASALSTGGGALLIAGGAAWLWRTRLVGRRPAFAGLPLLPRAAVVRAVAPPACIALPAGIDRDQLLAELRLHFVRLQDAWDGGDAAALGRLATPEMVAELQLELPGCSAGPDSPRTEVVTLQASLLGFEALAQANLVSVEFSGLIRELPTQGATPFRELWLLTRSKHEADGWRLARHQALF